MTSARITVADPRGLHTRPASELVKLAGECDSATIARQDGRRVDLKSVLSVIGLRVKFTETVVIDVEGAGAENVLDSMIAVLTEPSTVSVA